MKLLVRSLVLALMLSLLTPSLVSLSNQEPSGPSLPPTMLFGVTVDSLRNLPAIVDSLQSLSRKPTTRVVFDEYVPATDYRAAVEQLHDVSHVMGELLDSYYVKEYSVEEYTNRTAEYLQTLGSSVDIWEIGNEINGEWLGKTRDVVAKMTSAYRLVKEQGRTTALTLYYNEDCWAKPQNEMFTWAERNIPPEMRQGLDYVFVSYYEDDCNDLQPEWHAVFRRLGRIFPNSKIGFGEVGTTHKKRKSEYVTRYYSMNLNHPRFVGGYFWWYFRQDMVPRSRPLWHVLDEAIRPK